MACVCRLKQLTKTQREQTQLFKFYTTEDGEDSSGDEGGTLVQILSIHIKS